MTAVARRTDPTTSHLAAQAATKVPARERVLAILHEQGPSTHDQIIAAHRRKAVTVGWPQASASRLRTATHELADAGLVEPVPHATGRSALGHRSLIWRATTVQGA